MKYEGLNKEGFERDARLLLEHFVPVNTGSAESAYKAESAFLDAVASLAHDYGIGDSEIWDILPEYENGESEVRG